MKKWLATASATFLALTYSTAVFAHSNLGESTPTDGDIVTEPLQEITLSFDGQIEQGSYIDVQTQTGNSVAVDNIIIGDGILTATFAEALPNDDYRVNWSIISADGHPLEGTFSFNVNTPVQEVAPEPEAAVTPADEQVNEVTNESHSTEESSSLTGIIAVIAIVILAAVVLVMRKKK